MPSRHCRVVTSLQREDTRQTRKSLTHFEITPSMLFSYHEHNKGASGPELIRYIIEGKNLALVSDAGLPAISDPGSDLVQLALEAGITVIPIPGPNLCVVCSDRVRITDGAFYIRRFFATGEKGHAKSAGGF